jgi:hypothetical protein
MSLSGVLGYNVKPFKVDLSSRMPHLKDLVKLTKLPEASVLGKAGAGIELAWLKDRQQEWLEEFDWEKEQSAMNKSVWCSSVLVYVLIAMVASLGLTTPLLTSEI